MVLQNLISDENLSYYAQKYDTMDRISHDEFLNSMLEAQKKMLSVKVEEEKCYLAESPIHGMGVFAKHDIPRGDSITTYPYHQLDIRHPGTIFAFTQYSARDFEPSTEYSFDIDEQFTLFGDRNKTDVFGHMINDASKPASRSFADMVEYNCRSGRNNCERDIKHVRVEFDHSYVYLPVVYFNATRNIKKDEEITVSYGSDFWHFMLNFEQNARQNQTIDNSTTL